LKGEDYKGKVFFIIY